MLVAAGLFLLWKTERSRPVTDAEAEAAMERFGIGAGSGHEAAAKALLDAEAKQPGLIRRAMDGEPEALDTVQGIVTAQALPGEGIETYSDEERALVREMVAAGYDNKAIQAALDKRRAGNPARTRRELMAARQANTPWIPREVLERIPVEWGLGRSNKKDDPGSGKEGWRWEDPANKGNGVRIDKGNLGLLNETQQKDHAVVRSGGVVLGRNGRPIPGTIKDNAEDAHIPMQEYRSWPEWNKGQR